MEAQALICPNCGAPYRRTVPSGVAQVRCNYCGAAIVIPMNAPRCPNHPNVLATAVCNDCGSNYCVSCLTAYEVGEESERGTLLLCSNCLSNRQLAKAERTVLVGALAVLLGIFFAFINLIGGILFIAFFAVPIIVYGFYSARSSQKAGDTPFGRHTPPEKQETDRTTHEMYQYTLSEFAKSFGVVRGTLMLENRIKAYMSEGLSREEAIKKLAKEMDY